MANVEYMSDPDDFCRACRGKGSERYKTERNTYITDTCWHCGGSGQKSIRVSTGEKQ